MTAVKEKPVKTEHPPKVAVMKPRSRISVSKVIIYVALSIWAVTTIYPFLWVILNSFKPKNMITVDSFSFPFGDLFTTDNYIKAFSRVNIGNAYKNSLVITILTTLAVVIIAGLCAYGLARYQFRGRKALHSLVIASMMFPAFSTIIPVFMMEAGWGIANTDSQPLTWLSIILPQTAGNLSFAIIVLMGFIRGLPVDLEEAAYLEGCNVFQIFFKIIIPVTKPSFMTVSIFTFLWVYNDLFTQLFLLRGEDNYTITRLLNEITSKAGTDFGMLAASVVLVVIPVLIVYMFLQKYIIKGMTAGAMKG